MARTHRNLEALIKDSDGDSIMLHVNCRRLVHHSTRRTELRAADAIREAGLVVRNRVHGRASGGTLPNQRNDRKIAAELETGYRNDRFDRRVRDDAAL